jgi:hypothetical protein
MRHNAVEGMAESRGKRRHHRRGGRQMDQNNRSEAKSR